MFAYIDESGNTGPNLFDPAQPGFYSVAAISRKDIDLVYAGDFGVLAARLGLGSLHGAQMGAARLDLVLPDVGRMIDRDGIRFFVGIINKHDLVLIKLADALFDCFENRAVPWHVYNVRTMRLLTVLKLSLIADEDCLEQFWGALMQQNPRRAQSEFVACLNKLRARIDRIPDRRSREIINDAIGWAVKNPDAITVHVQRSIRLSHLPHLVVFPSIINAIQRQSEQWKVAVTEIRHDRESLVATALTNWHELISQAPVTVMKWVDFEYPVGGAPGSRFSIVSSKDSAGLQLADIVLWLIRRTAETGELSSTGEVFLSRVLQNSHPFELSLNAINETLERDLSPIMSMPMTEEQLDEGRKLLSEIELRRKEGIAKFDRERR